ncbi:MAG TPA: alcohol dehydrogenase catalytic domain-containing protein [Aggregatilineales bacterium]|nr:alcohol dehydrogenase catalytic domain-containing protein [Aggregatilineales bacterium]
MVEKVVDKLTQYRRAEAPLPTTNRILPTYGAGFENVGRDGQPIDVPMPTYGPDELLVRHDACGLCFSDIKIIKLGQEHPRIHRKDMQTNPIVQGHEVCLTVVGVGAKLRNQYHVGDRFIVQADIFVKGVGWAYGYEIQGGLSEYSVIDQRVLNGDDGNYLIPVQPNTGYAESALTEPWACVIAAYGLKYRTALKSNGTAWIIGTSPDDPKPYTISAGFDAASHPSKLLLTDVSAKFAAWLTDRARTLGVEVIEVGDLANPPVQHIDDVVLLGIDPAIIETVSPRLADFGVFAILADKPADRRVSVDIGRIHYNRWIYVGGTKPDIARAYGDVPARPVLKGGGRVWFVGAGGPMGRMHVQRAIQIAEGPGTIVCTDVSDLRLTELCESFEAEARAKGIEFICLNPTVKDAYTAGMARFKDQGFDDIVVLAPIPAVISDAGTYLAPNGTMNIFAGVARGTFADLELSGVYLKGMRFFGHSASSIDDLRLMLHQAESGELSTNRAVAAVGSLSASKDGLVAVRDTALAGKVVIFPHIKEMPLTPLPELKDKLPTVYARLKNGREWTLEAEQEFLRLMLE